MTQEIGNGRSFDDASVKAAEEEKLSILRTEYKATTNRMLRVATNGFMENVKVVLEVMEELDVNMLAAGTN